MIVLVIGPAETIEADMVLETDLGHPIEGLPGVVGLYMKKTLILQYYIGYSSPKHNTKKYLNSVHQCFHKFRSEHNEKSLLVHCHNWSSGIGRVLISDIIRITQPSQITEYYTKTPQLEMIYDESVSFLGGVYHKSPADFNSIEVASAKTSDFKAFRSKTISKYLGANDNVPLSLANSRPRVCFASDITIILNDEKIGNSYIKGIIGKIAGLCSMSTRECFGLGLVRDYDAENGMIYVVTPLQDLAPVDCIEVYSGDNTIALEKNDIYSESFAESIEFDIPHLLSGGILLEKITKYHPSRNFTK